jgi:peptidoglycan/LPS O-acetylase OafA/YrhL
MDTPTCKSVGVKMTYRPDIDGLRAIAVLAVILFHAGFDTFSGGFVGVDIFFVISGYLITNILAKEIERNEFSLVNFYERRARRILPALFLVMICCIPIALAWMHPIQLKDFAQSLVAVNLFASNILFFLESDYFGADAEEKPLLHTWSLAVEEQYYIVFPVVLLISWRYGKKKSLIVVAFLAFISFLMSEWGWRYYEIANFYLAPFRIWELLTGSIAALAIGKIANKNNDLLVASGLVGIILPIFLYSDHTPFPSFYALAPVIGTFIIIVYGGTHSKISQALSLKPIVFVGLISYSAYLWHQPLFAFARVIMMSEPSKLAMFGLSVLSLLLAVTSWKYIETPFRSKQKYPRKHIFILSLLFITVLSSIGVVGHVTNGYRFLMSSDYTSRVELLERLSLERISKIGSGTCHFNGKGPYTDIDKFIENWDCKIQNFGKSDQLKIAVYGDSHSADKAIALRENGISVTQIGGASCPLILNTLTTPSHCTKIFNRFIEEVNSREYDYVFLANRFIDNEINAEYLQKIVNFWAAFNLKVVIFTGMPEFHKFEQVYAKSIISATQMDYDKDLHENMEGAFESLKALPNVNIVNTKKIFCALTESRCQPILKDTPLLVDYGNLSVEGSRLFGQYLLHDFIEKNNGKGRQH